MPNKDNELDPNSLSFIKDSIRIDYSNNNDIFYNISQICYGKQKVEKLDNTLYNNKIGKILNCKIKNSIQSDYIKFLSEYIIPKNKINILNDFVFTLKKVRKIQKKFNITNFKHNNLKKSNNSNSKFGMVIRT